MASNVLEFWAHYTNVPASAQYTALPKQPFGATIATGSALGIEVTFVCTGYDGSATYIGIDKWLIAARYSSTNNVSATASHRTVSRIGSSGGSVSRLAGLDLSISSGTPRLMWTPVAAGNRWTIRGHLWVVSAA